MILVVIGVITLYFLFRPTRHKNITIVDADKPLSGKSTYLTSPKIPHFNGFMLKFNSYISNTLFGSLILTPNAHKDDFLGLNKLSNQKCSYLPTFYPVRAPKPGSVELAKETDNPPDSSHLRNSFTSEWKPKTIDDYISAYLGGLVNPVMIAEDIIAKIKFVNSEMRIFVDWSENLIIEQAEASKTRYENGKPLSAFDGVPIVIKDQLDVKGLTTRCGVEIEGKIALADSVVVERLRKQGMIILGQVNMHQMGVGVTGVNPSKYAGFCPNPYNLDYHPGASSSGTAVALALGIAPVGIGTDGGGSVRIPAS